jgi:hypothetical protein
MLTLLIRSKPIIREDGFDLSTAAVSMPYTSADDDRRSTFHNVPSAMPNRLQYAPEANESR